LLLVLTSAKQRFEAADTSSGEPWTASEVITPKLLASQIESGAAKNTHVVCVAFSFMYKAAHIPNAVYIGPGRDPKASDRLKMWAAKLPKNDTVLIYCGCCPMKECPNVRPAFAALKEMKFTHVMVLDIPRSFAQDWVRPGFPVERQSASTTEK
jgi:thiosulfate/3-mercaptopyruvate sulfurtransferase